MPGALKAGIALLAPLIVPGLTACGPRPPSTEDMAATFTANRPAFERLREGMCASARRWTSAYPDDPRGPAWAMPAREDFGPWMTEPEKAEYRGLLNAIGATYAVVEEITPECILNVGYWSAPAPLSGGYVDHKAWFYGNHWRRKLLAVASDGRRPWHPGRPKGEDAIVFRATLRGGWSVITYRTRGPDY